MTNTTMARIFGDVAREVFGTTDDVPETIPLRILGLVPPVPNREAIVAAFRRRALEVHPDLQLAYDHPVLQAGAEVLATRPEIRELVWARDVLLSMVPEPVTASNGGSNPPRSPVTPGASVCRKCQRECEHYAVMADHSRRARWCWRCVQADDTEQAKERRRRRRANRRCAHCAAVFTPPRSDGRYCSARCRQAAFRGRVTAAQVARERSAEPLRDGEPR